MDNKKRFTFAVLLLLFSLISVLPFLIASESELFNFLEQPLIILLPTVLITIIYLSKTKIALNNFYCLNKINLKDILLLSIIVLLMPAIVNYVTELFDFLVMDYSGEEVISINEDNSGLFYEVLDFIYKVVFFAVFPGVIEEILFRGTILGLLKELKLNYLVIILINGVLFGLFHANLEQFFYTTVMGFILTAIVYATKSLYASIYVHILYNFLVSLPDLVDIDNSKILSNLIDIMDNTKSLFWAMLSSLAVMFIIHILNSSRKVKTEEEFYKDAKIN